MVFFISRSRDSYFFISQSRVSKNITEGVRAVSPSDQSIISRQKKNTIITEGGRAVSPNDPANILAVFFFFFFFISFLYFFFCHLFYLSYFKKCLGLLHLAIVQPVRDPWTFKLILIFQVKTQLAQLVNNLYSSFDLIIITTNIISI